MALQKNCFVVSWFHFFINSIFSLSVSISLREFKLCVDSALFPFVIGKITKPPAPPAPERNLIMPKIALIGSSPSMNDFGGIFKSLFGNQ
ncbi:MAG: hypothetical protein ACI8RD_014860 [Bacillariaceae sp.]|jgi:hypothetical protein